MDRRWIRSLLLPLLCLLPLHSLPCCAQIDAATGATGEVLASPTTGMEGTLLNLVLAGAKLEPKPLEDSNSPIVLRVVQAFPHVDDWRYDLSFYGLVPGRYDLRDFLQREDGSAIDGVPAIPVEVLAVRPLGELVRPDLELQRPPRLGGYKLALIAAGVFWLGMLALLLFGFRKKTDEQLAQRIRQLTLADVLLPLVKKAQAGELSQSGQAELERTLLRIWRKRLNLEDEDPATAMIKLRADPEAGGLLRELERWLHRPGSAGDVDVVELLRPYENLPAEEV